MEKQYTLLGNGVVKLFLFLFLVAFYASATAQETHSYFTKGDKYGWYMCMDDNGSLLQFPTPALAAQCFIDSWEKGKNDAYIASKSPTRCSGQYVGYKHDKNSKYLEGGEWIGWAKIQLSCTNGWSELIHDWCPERTQNPNYIVVVPKEEDIPNCTVGNPIAIADGKKIQREIDIPAKSQNGVGFSRVFHRNNWKSDYQQEIYIPDPISSPIFQYRSREYSTKTSACTSGWDRLKSSVTESWAAGTTAVLENGACRIKKNNVTVKNLPVIKKLFRHEILRPINIVLKGADGSELSYYLHQNKWLPTSGENNWLEQVNDGSASWRLKTSNGNIEDYDQAGKLISITSSTGLRQSLEYDATSGLLSRVTDAAGRELVFVYTGNQISSVTMDGNKTTSYTYNAAGLITQVTRPDNTTRIYHYEDTRFPTALTGITDEREVRYATWTYDAQGRAISSEHAGGAEKTLLAFNADGSTTVTNALNKQTIYRFADIAGARRVTKVEGQPTANCMGANQDYTYTPEGWIASKTDWKGIKTTFTYNAAGQEISRTEALGTPEARTTTTEWHPTLFVKTKITEPEKETIYSYDINGRLVNELTQSITVQ